MGRARAAGMWLVAVALVVLLQAAPSGAASVVVHNGYELHAAMTSPSIDWILLADNVS